MATDLSWQDKALCSGAEGDSYFDYDDRVTAEAKGICRMCRVQVECLEWALFTDERYGVWGGADEDERKLLRRAMRFLEPREIAEHFARVNTTRWVRV